MVQQYDGSSIDIFYSKDDLKQIFIRNILKEKAKNLVYPQLKNKDPLFFVFRFKRSNK